MAGSPAGLPKDNSKAQALVEEFLEQKRREEPASRKSLSTRHGRTVAMVCMTIICAAVWLAPYPASSANEAMDPVVESASARLTVFLAGAKVREFRTKKGRLPSTLEEAGVVDASMEYARATDSSFTLESTVVGQHILYDSRDEPHAMLGGAVSIIEKKGR